MKFKSFVGLQNHLFSKVCMIGVTLLFAALASSAQTGIYLYTGSMTTITLNPGIYNITAYGAQGGGTIGYNGGLGAEMEARFALANPTTLTQDPPPSTGLHNVAGGGGAC